MLHLSVEQTAHLYGMTFLVSGFVTACRHLVAPGGLLAAMKGAYPKAELEKVPAGCDCRRVIALKVPMLDAERHLVLCQVSG